MDHLKRLHDEIWANLQEHDEIFINNFLNSSLNRLKRNSSLSSSIGKSLKELFKTPLFWICILAVILIVPLGLALIIWVLSLSD